MRQDSKARAVNFVHRKNKERERVFVFQGGSDLKSPLTSVSRHLDDGSSWDFLAPVYLIIIS